MFRLNSSCFNLILHYPSSAKTKAVDSYIEISGQNSLPGTQEAKMALKHPNRHFKNKRLKCPNRLFAEIPGLRKPPQATEPFRALWARNPKSESKTSQKKSFPSPSGPGAPIRPKRVGKETRTSQKYPFLTRF